MEIAPRGSLARLAALVAVALIVVAACPDGARAEDTREQAMVRFREGRKLYQVGEYRAALEEFKRGYLLKDDPVFLFNMAQCHRQLGDTREALVFYRRYLAASPNAENRKQVEKSIGDLERAAAEPAVPPPPPPPVTGAAARTPSPTESTTPATRPPEPVAPAFVAAAPAAAPPERSSSRWWLWTSGAVVLVAGAVTTAVLLSRDHADPNCRSISPCGTVR
jgi:tetratricopeptide (TPR) repeat protein